MRSSSKKASEYGSANGGSFSRCALIDEEAIPLHMTHCKLQVLLMENSICLGHSGSGAGTENSSHLVMGKHAKAPDDNCQSQ